MVNRKHPKSRPNNSKARLASGTENAISKKLRDFFSACPIDDCDKSLKDLFFMALEHEGGTYWTPEETSHHAFFYRFLTELLWELEGLTKQKPLSHGN